MTDHELSCYIVGRQNHNVLAHQPNRVYKLAESHSQHYPKLLLGQIAQEFAAEIYDKAVKAQAKYGYPELGWATPDWEAALQRGLAEHIQEGDPRDVAVYAMFAWFHEWSTAATPAPADAAGAGESAGAAYQAQRLAEIQELRDWPKTEGMYASPGDLCEAIDYLIDAVKVAQSEVRFYERATRATPTPATAAPEAAEEATRVEYGIAMDGVAEQLGLDIFNYHAGDVYRAIMCLQQQAYAALALDETAAASAAPEAGPVGGLFLQGDPATNPFGPR